MPRKTRKDLVDRDEDQAQDARDTACRQLAADLHRSWRIPAHPDTRTTPSRVRHRVAVL
jgi:hypothetical protein